MNKRTIAIASLACMVGLLAGLWLGHGRTAVGEGKAAVYRCPMHPTVVTDHPSSCPVCGMDLVKDAVSEATEPAVSERRILHWRAPMDPTYTSDKPGKSPMGMDLIPVYEDERSDAASVRIDPTTIQNMGVKTATVRRGSLSRTIRTVGRVDYDETRITDVNTKMSGWVEELFVDFTGQRVRKGEPLLEIYSPELVSAQEEYLSALGSRRGLLASTKRRLLYWDVTEEQIAELTRTRKVKRTMTVYSPQEGVVVHKAVFDGAHIDAGEHLYRIADLSRVWVYADVFEYEFPWIEEGQAAEVALPYEPGRALLGEVVYIYPFMDKKTRAVQVRMAFPNEDRNLKPEMYANVEIRPLISREALTVPVQSVIHSGSRNVVIRSLGKGRFRPQDVTIGVEGDGVYEILDGLRDGDVIVTSSQFLIDSESNLKAALMTMTSDGSEDAPSPATTPGHSH